MRVCEKGRETLVISKSGLVKVVVMMLVMLMKLKMVKIKIKKKMKVKVEMRWDYIGSYIPFSNFHPWVEYHLAKATILIPHLH